VLRATASSSAFVGTSATDAVELARGRPHGDGDAARSCELRLVRGRGLLIQTSVGIAGGVGRPLTKRSGFFAYAAARIAARAAKRSRARPAWRSSGVRYAMPAW